MKRNPLFILLVLVVAALGLAACGSKESPAKPVSPSTLEEIEGSELKRVILTEKAAERIGVQAVEVDGLTVPYAAVVYDTEGGTWVYTNPSALAFERVQVIIDRIEGDTAFLAERLETDAPVITVGVMEIYGSETGVSK
jgi:hypothetical protein